MQISGHAHRRWTPKWRVQLDGPFGAVDVRLIWELAPNRDDRAEHTALRVIAHWVGDNQPNRLIDAVLVLGARRVHACRRLLPKAERAELDHVDANVK